MNFEVKRERNTVVYDTKQNSLQKRQEQITLVLIFSMLQMKQNSLQEEKDDIDDSAKLKNLAMRFTGKTV